MLADIFKLNCIPDLKKKNTFTYTLGLLFTVALWKLIDKYHHFLLTKESNTHKLESWSSACFVLLTL